MPKPPSNVRPLLWLIALHVATELSIRGLVWLSWQIGPPSSLHRLAQSLGYGLTYAYGLLLPVWLTQFSGRLKYYAPIALVVLVIVQSLYFLPALYFRPVTSERDAWHYATALQDIMFTPTLFASSLIAIVLTGSAKQIQESFIFYGPTTFEISIRWLICLLLAASMAMAFVRVTIPNPYPLVIRTWELYCGQFFAFAAFSIIASPIPLVAARLVARSLNAMQRLMLCLLQFFLAACAEAAFYIALYWDSRFPLTWNLHILLVVVCTGISLPMIVTAILWIVKMPSDSGASATIEEETDERSS